MKTPSKDSRHAGFTLPELLTTICVLGILCSIAIASYSGLQTSAREGVSRDTMATLNRAVLHFNQANWDIVLHAIPNSAADELSVLRALQWRDPDPQKATPGSSYISPHYCDETSSSDQDFRIQWNGHAFELIAPGTAGTGLKTGTLEAEATSTYSFPAGYELPAAGQYE
jgi:prepilin-type N-terminal cleavage/methylation domain-containing protein